MEQAAQVKRRLAETLSQRLDVHGQGRGPGKRVPAAAGVAFPDPWELAGAETLEQLPAHKLTKLRATPVRGYPAAAAAGRLDARYLRALPYARALEEIQQLSRIGPWSAAQIRHPGTRARVSYCAARGSRTSRRSTKSG